MTRKLKKQLDVLRADALEVRGGVGWLIPEFDPEVDSANKKRQDLLEAARLLDKAAALIAS